ncbi:hypothetical protein [Streptomyces sp. NPDC056600]|uniref:hypothetical protein n=1 Tax=Streptomyces sp. NPDC056600 TaxID=3345874 RepID=UPI00367C2267
MKLSSAHRTALRCALPALLLTAVTACGASDEDGASKGKGASAAQAGNGTTSQALPLAAYSELSEDDSRTIRRASDLLMQQCMEKYGFTDTAAAGDETGTEKPVRDSDYRMLPSDHASAYGYHPKGGGTVATDRGDGKAGSDAENAVRLGTGAATVNGKAVPKGGCKGEVDRKLSDGLPDVNDAGGKVDEVVRATTQQAESDQALTKAVQKWGSCMKEQGFVFAHPREAAGRFLGKGTAKASKPSEGARVSAVATDEEKQVAVADSSCNKKAALEQAWLKVIVPLQQEAIDQHAEEFEVMAEWNKGYLANAKSALESN